MKYTLLYICTLFFVSFCGFGQKQVTDYQSDISISSDNSVIWGEINEKIYLYTGGSEVWALDKGKGSWEFVGDCPKSIISSKIMLIENNFYFFSIQEGGSWWLNKFDVNTGYIQNKHAGWGNLTFYQIENVLFLVMGDRKLCKISIGDNFKVDVLMEGHIELLHNEAEESLILKVNKEEDSRKYHVYSTHNGSLLKLDSFETKGYNNTPQYFYRVLKKTQRLLLFERTVQTSQNRDIFLTDLSSGKTQFRYTAKYQKYEESDKYYRIDNDIVHVEMSKPAKLEKLSFKFHVFKTNGEKDTFEKLTQQYDRLEIRGGLMSAPYHSNISNYIFSDSCLYFLSNKHSNVLPLKDSLEIYINRLNIKDRSIKYTPLNVKLNTGSESNYLGAPLTFRIRISDKTIGVFPAVFTDSVYYFNLNLNSSVKKVIADELHYQKLSENLFIKLDSSTYRIIDEKKQTVWSGSLPERKIKSSGLGYDEYRLLDGHLFMIRKDQNGYRHINVFDGQNLSELDLGRITYASLPDYNVVDGFVSFAVQDEEAKDVVYHLKDKTLLTVKKNSELKEEGFKVFSKRANAPLVLSNGLGLISVNEKGEILNSLLPENGFVYQPVHQFPDGNLIIRKPIEDTGDLYDKNFSKIKTLPLGSLYPIAFSRDGKLLYFFDNELLKCINSRGDIQTVIRARTFQEYNSNPYGKYVFVDQENRDYYILDLVTSKVQVLSFDAKKYYSALLSFVQDGVLATAFLANGKGGELFFFNLNGERKKVRGLSNGEGYTQQQDKGGVPYNKFSHYLNGSDDYNSLFLWENQELKKVGISDFQRLEYLNTAGEVLILSTKSPETKVIADFKNDVYFEISGAELEDISSVYFAFNLDNIYVFQSSSGLSEPKVFFVDAKTKKYTTQNNYLSEQTFRTLNDKVYFIGHDLIAGFEVWNSDGSVMGSGLVFDINQGGLGSNPSEIFELKNNLFVFATNSQSGLQLWQLTDNEPKDEEKDMLLSIENPNLNFSFYPNPTPDFLNVNTTSIAENKYRITVFSIDGKIILEQNLELPQKLDLSGLKTGVYLINLRNGKENKTLRVVKQ